MRIDVAGSNPEVINELVSSVFSARPTVVQSNEIILQVSGATQITISGSGLQLGTNGGFV